MIIQYDKDYDLFFILNSEGLPADFLKHYSDTLDNFASLQVMLAKIKDVSTEEPRNKLISDYMEIINHD